MKKFLAFAVAVLLIVSPASAAEVFHTADQIHPGTFGATNAGTFGFNGSVGIGTTSPSGLFHINTTAGAHPRIAFSIDNLEAALIGLVGNGGGYFPGSVIGDTAIRAPYQGRILLGSGAISLNKAPAVTILANDRVGIGTMTPSGKLNIVGASELHNFNLSYNGMQFGIYQGNVGGAQGVSLGTMTNHNLTFYTNNGDKLRLDPAGNLSFIAPNTGILFQDGSFQTTAGGGGGSGDGHSLDADDGSPTDALYVDADGDVGIGDVNPSKKFVVGDGTSELMQVGVNAPSSWTTNAGQALSLGSSGAHQMTFTSTDVTLTPSNNGKLRLQDSGTGNVRIGTALEFPDSSVQTTAGTPKLLISGLGRLDNNRVATPIASGGQNSNNQNAVGSQLEHEDTVRMRVPLSGILKNLYVWVDAGNGGEFIVRKNGDDTNLKVSVGTASNANKQDTSNTVPVTAGDYITVHLSGASGGADLSWSFVLEQT